MTSPSRRLPNTTRPAHHETVTSYVRRLANLHAIPYKQLWQQLSAAPSHSARTRRLIVAERLAAVTGHRLVELANALPELRHPAPDWQQWRCLPQPACPGCTARHPGGPVIRLFAHHQYVCTRHGYWIGPPVPTIPHLHPQPLVRLIPELATAQRRHQRLQRRHGWLRTLAALDAATSLCLDQRFQHRPGTSPRSIWDNRLGLLIPTRHRFNTSIFLAAFYPEIVNVAAILCSTRHMPPAAQAVAPEQRLAAINSQFGRAIGCPDPPQHVLTSCLPAITATPPPAHPASTFPQSRRATHDGVPTRPSAADERLARKATKEFAKHRHVPPWALPRHLSRPPPDLHPETITGNAT